MKLPIWIARENRPLDYWYDQFQEAGEITLATARQLNWLSGTVGEQPALERLEKMVGLRSVKEAVRRRMRSLKFSNYESAKDKPANSCAYTSSSKAILALGKLPLPDSGV